jgi:hypothetical protein
LAISARTDRRGRPSNNFSINQINFFLVFKAKARLPRFCLLMSQYALFGFCGSFAKI